MTGTKIVAPSDSQDNNISKWGRQRDLNKSEVSTLHSKW